MWHGHLDHDLRARIRHGGHGARSLLLSADCGCGCPLRIAARWSIIRLASSPEVIELVGDILGEKRGLAVGNKSLWRTPASEPCDYAQKHKRDKRNCLRKFEN